MSTLPTAGAVYSVWRRYAHVYKKTWLVNFLPPMSEPVLYLIAFGLGLSPLIRSFSYLGTPVDYLRFIAPGMIAVAVMYQSFFEGSYGPFVRYRFQRTWQAMLTTPLTFADVFAGELLWAATKGVIGGLLTGLVALTWGICTSKTLLFGLPVMIFGSLLFAAVGMCTAGLAKTINHINIPVFVFVVPMFVLCGTYFPRENLPFWLNLLAGLLPLSAIVDLLRWDMGLPYPMLYYLLLLGCWLVTAVLLAWHSLHKRLFRLA